MGYNVGYGPEWAPRPCPHCGNTMHLCDSLGHWWRCYGCHPYGRDYPTHQVAPELAAKALPHHPTPEEERRAIAASGASFGSAQKQAIEQLGDGHD